MKTPQVLPPANGIDNTTKTSLANKARSILLCNKKLKTIAAIVVFALVVAGLYLYGGADAIVRRGSVGLGDKIALKTPNGYVTKPTFDSVVTSFKLYGYKDIADAKSGLPSAKDAAKNMLASEGYLAAVAKKNNIVLDKKALDDKLRVRYGASVTSEKFYKQYKNPEQMKIYIETEAKLQLYKDLVAKYVVKGKQATVLTLAVPSFTVVGDKLTAEKVQVAQAAIKKDVQENYRPALNNKASAEAAQAALKSRKLNTGGLDVAAGTAAQVATNFYPQFGGDGTNDSIKKLAAANNPKLALVTVSTVLNSLKVGEVSAATQLTVGGLVVVRYDADYSNNLLSSWDDLPTVAVKQTKTY